MKKLIDFLQKGTCAATVVREMEQRFQEAGFEKPFIVGVMESHRRGRLLCGDS